MPRTFTTETTVYTFAELSDKAKEKARDWYREASQGDTYFSEHVIEDAVRIGELFGLTIDTETHTSIGGYETIDGETKWNPSKKKTWTSPAVHFSGFSSQGDGASFEGTYEYKPGGLAVVMDYAPQDKKLHDIVATLENIGLGVCFDITTSGSYSHSGCMSFELRDQYDTEGELINVEEMFSRDTIEQAQEALKAFADWIYENLEAEYNYQNSAEYIDETIEANEYEFTEHGERV